MSPAKGQYSCPHGSAERVVAKNGRSRCNACNRANARRRTGFPLDAPKHPPGGRTPKKPRPFKCGHPRDTEHLGWVLRTGRKRPTAYCKVCYNERSRKWREEHGDLGAKLSRLDREIRQAIAEADWVETRQALRAQRIKDGA